MKLETGKLDSELLKKIVFGKITYRSEGPYFIGGKRYRPFGDPYHVQ